MSSPKVFVSSTFYDLKHIRENLKYFIKTIGYDPILSEDGAVFYDPALHTHDACLSEVPNCQLFVLIIGGKHGGNFRDSSHSITNAEYREAVKLKIPVFALVEHSVLAEHHVFLKNKDNKEVDCSKIRYPAVDDTRIFNFIDEVRKNAVNNAIVSFRDFADIESYLRQQWAGMMFSFLLRQNESSRVADSLSMLQSVNERIEMLSRQILTSVGTESAKVTTELYDEMLASDPIRDLSWMKLNPTPVAVLKAETYSELAMLLGKPLKAYDGDEDDDEFDGNESMSMWGDGKIGSSRLAMNSDNYITLRNKLIEILQKHGITPDAYIRQEDQNG